MFELYRPPASQGPPTPYTVYPSSLFCLGLGYALWYPEPHDLTGEARIGDVGYIDDGSFVRLFNLDASAKPDHRVTCWGSDKIFQPVPPPPEGVLGRVATRSTLPPNHYHSRGVVRSDFNAELKM